MLDGFVTRGRPSPSRIARISTVNGALASSLRCGVRRHRSASIARHSQRLVGRKTVVQLRCRITSTDLSPWAVSSIEIDVVSPR